MVLPKSMKYLVSFFIATITSYIALKYLPLPHLWISLFWFLCLLFWAIITTRSLSKIIWFNIAIMVLLCGGLEVYAWATRSIPPERIYSQGYYRMDEILGSAPLKGKTAASRFVKDNEIVYNVTYTIDDNGLRISPPATTDAQCLVFFGCSYTFGEGVEDHEAMPYQVGKISGCKVYNFAFHGYGPHQMLAALERGIVNRVVECQPSVGIYQAIPDHVYRVTGSKPWGRHGPKYVLSPTGTPSYVGHFDDFDGSLRSQIAKQIKRSYAYKKYLGFRSPNPKQKKRNVELFLAIVDAARSQFLRRYPSAAFHVILWKDKRDVLLWQMIEQGMRQKGFNLHLSDEILPFYSARISKYKISPHDGHPNAHAHELIAQYVVDKIVGMKDK